MKQLDPRENRIKLRTQILVFFLSSLVGVIALIVDLVLDFIVLGKNDFFQYLHFEISNNQIITRRFWVILFPVSGLFIHYIISHNVMEKEKMERLLNRTEEQLFRAQKMEIVGQFITSIIHDFNNMLQVMDTNIEFMKQQCNTISHKTSQDLLHSLAQINQTIEHSKGLVNQLLLFSKSKPQLTNEPIDVNEAIQENTRLISNLLGNEIRMELELQNNPIFVNSNKSKLDQVLMNLFVNAKDAMPDGGKITVSTDTQVVPSRWQFQECVEIMVKDTGIGMDKQMIKKAFEPFYSTKKGGTGLGLFTVHSIVEQYNGEIAIQSNEGIGTTFRIYLPLKH